MQLGDDLDCFFDVVEYVQFDGRIIDKRYGRMIFWQEEGDFSRALDRCLNSNKASVIEIEIDPKQITTRQRMEELNN